MSFQFFSQSALLALLLASARGGVLPWAPCANLNPTVCQSSDFSARPSGGVSSDAGLSATGTWNVASHVLTESSRATGTGSGDSCVNQLGVIQYMPITNLDNLFQLRVKVRVNATGGAAGVVFGDRNGAYFRFQLNTNSACKHNSAVAFRTTVQGAPAGFSQVTQLSSTAARTSAWYELRLRISFADSTHGRLDVSIIEQDPLPGPVLTGPSITLDNPSLSVGTKIGLWCSSSSGCDFKDYVIVQDSLRAALTGQLDCHACNLMWVDGQSDWCRCCQQDCPPFDRSACVRKGLCTSLCTSNQYCSTPTTLAPMTPAATSPATPSTTTTATTTTTAPIGTSTPIGTGNPATPTITSTSSTTAPIGTGSDSSTTANGGSSPAQTAGGDTTTSVAAGGSGSTTNTAAGADATLVPSSAASASAAAALGMLAAAAVI